MHSMPRLVSLKEFSNILNASTNDSIGDSAIYQMIKLPGFPALKIGNRFYIMIDRVQSWMEAQFAQETMHEPGKEADSHE